MKQEEFIGKVAPLAVADMKKTGVLASVTIAQAILESGWGTSALAVNARNLFGMKANLSGNTWPSAWDGRTYSKATGEQKPDGTRYTVTADFRLYDTIEESIEDHSAYLTGAMNGKKKRYAGLAGERDARTALTIIRNGGYATSLDYVDNLMRIIDVYDLTEYDKEGGGEPMKEIKIMLDAGHYGKYNRSPANGAYYESVFTWDFHKYLEAALQRRGFIVGTTRKEQEKDLALKARGTAAAGYNLFISIHSNAVGSGVNDAVDYPVAITMVEDAKTDIDEISKAVGERLAQTVAEVMGTRQAARTYTKKSANDRDGNGIFDDEYYGVLNGAKAVKVPGLILEHSFHTCARSTAWLMSADNLRAMAEAEADTLAAYFGVIGQQTGEDSGQVQEDSQRPAEGATDGQEGQQAAGEWYRVRKSWEDAKSQIGAYRVKENALRNCPEGYSVYDSAGNAIYSNRPQDTGVNKWYRVRKSWEDAESQVGAYKLYDNAVNSCPEGYAVFDDEGRVLYKNEGRVPVYYAVRAGDTLGKIAKEYGTTPQQIVEANRAKYPRITADFIVVGWGLEIV